MSRIVLGTRGSDLARRQARLVEEALRATWPAVEICIEIITTRGDENAPSSAELIDRKAGRKGLFTNELERALLAGEINLAVHSAKDLPSAPIDGLEIAAALPRAAVDDVLITTKRQTWESLGRSATVATGSVRRRFQVGAQRPDVQVVDLRGNVPTRLRKLTAAGWDGIILARAGLERLGFDLSTEEFEFDGTRYHIAALPRAHFLSAGGQGIIALQVQAHDEAAELIGAVNHADTLLCLQAEREFLRLLDGDCDSPVGVVATIEKQIMTMRAQVFKPPAVQPLCGDVEGPAGAESVAALAARLLKRIDG